MTAGDMIAKLRRNQMLFGEKAGEVADLLEALVDAATTYDDLQLLNSTWARAHRILLNA